MRSATAGVPPGSCGIGGDGLAPTSRRPPASPRGRRRSRRAPHATPASSQCACPHMLTGPLGQLAGHSSYRRADSRLHRFDAVRPCSLVAVARNDLDPVETLPQANDPGVFLGRGLVHLADSLPISCPTSSGTADPPPTAASRRLRPVPPPTPPGPPPPRTRRSRTRPPGPATTNPATRTPPDRRTWTGSTRRTTGSRRRRR